MSLWEDIDTTARVRTLARRGLSDREIGDVLGVSGRTVLRWRKRHGIPSSWTSPVPEHGTLARYQSRGCRCTSCTAANAEARRSICAAAQRRSAGASRHDEPWTPGEDARVLSDAPVTALAAELGRTYYAVQNRRGVLRRREASNT